MLLSDLSTAHVPIFSLPEKQAPVRARSCAILPNVRTNLLPLSRRQALPPSTPAGLLYIHNFFSLSVPLYHVATSPSASGKAKIFTSQIPSHDDMPSLSPATRYC